MCSAYVTAADREFAPLRAFGAPLANTVAPTPYVALQTRNDATWRPGVRSYAKNGMVGELSQGLIDAIIDAFVPSDGVFLGTHTAGGAVARVGETDTAWPHRNVATMLVMGAAWTDAADDQRLGDATRRLFSAVEPFTGGYYDNIDSDGESVGGNYGPVYARLVSAKNTYDPLISFG